MYYFLVCDEHQELCPAASNEANLYNSANALPVFITEHSGCTLKVITDGGDDDIFNSYKNWQDYNSIKKKSFLRRLFRC